MDMQSEMVHLKKKSLTISWNRRKKILGKNQTNETINIFYMYLIDSIIIPASDEFLTSHI